MAHPVPPVLAGRRHTLTWWGRLSGLNIPGEVTEFSKLHLIAIGGFDPSGGAGLVRDGLTAQSLGSSFRLVGTAWAEQSAALGVQAIDARPASEVRKAIQLALKEAPPGRTGVKVGMAVNAEVSQAIVEGIEGFAGPVVFDPVLGATSGGALFDAGREQLLQVLAPLIARTWIITPNAHEAARLCEREVDTVEEAERCAKVFTQTGARAAVITGGHLDTADIVDVLAIQGEREAHRLEQERVPGPSVRGTGCCYASSLALHLAAGHGFVAACEAAQAHVADGIRHARPIGPQWHLGHT